MLYLYTLMMLAWDLDKDTHSYFRRYLDVFINKRQISKDLRELVRDTRSRAITSHIRPGLDTNRIFNELRISLPYRVFTKDQQINPYCAVPHELWFPEPAPNLIEDIHPSKYYHNARKPTRPHTNP